MSETEIPARLRKPLLHPLISEHPWWPGRIRRLFSQLAFHMLDKRLHARHADFRPAIPAMQTLMAKGMENAARQAPLVFAVGNIPYIRRFAPQLADSLARHAPNVPLWLHLIGPEKEQAASVAQEICGHNPGLPLTLTAEPTPVGEFEEQQRHRYCQCVRFAHVLTILEKERRPVLCIDIDTAFRGNPAAYHDTLTTSADVHFFIIPERDCGRRINAGCTWFNPSRSTQAFLKRATRRMFLHIQHGWFTEKLDQRCLCLTARSMAPELRVKALPKEFVSYDEKTACVLYTAKGARKKRLPLGVQESPPDRMPA